MASNGKEMSSMSMMDLFRQEAENHSSILSENLLEIKNDASDQDALGLLMRSAHSLKGAARIMDLDGLVLLASALEKVFVAAQNGKIVLDASAVEQLLKGVGKLGEVAGIADEEMESWLNSQKTDFEKLEEMYGDLATNGTVHPADSTVDTGETLHEPEPVTEDEVVKSPEGMVPPVAAEKVTSSSPAPEKKTESAGSMDLSSMSMMDLFRQEAETHCTTLSDSLLSLEKKPEDVEHLASLMRAAHSIKGAARVIDLKSIVSLAHVMEDAFVAAQEGRIILAADDMDILLKGVDKLQELAATTNDEVEGWLDSQAEKIDQLVEEYSALASGSRKITPVPEQPPPAGKKTSAAITKQHIKPESTGTAARPGAGAKDYPVDLSSMSMMDLFRQEAETHCATLSDNLLILERNAEDSEALASLMRAAHSIKGAARVIELNNIVGLAHAMEDVFVAAQEGRIVLGQDHVDVLLQGTDLFAGIAAHDDSSLEDWFREQEQAIQTLEAACRKMGSGKAPEPVRPQPAAPPQKRKEAKTIVTKEAFTKPLVREPDVKQTVPEKTADRSMRVSAEGMNRLMGFAGEVQVESRWLPSFAQKVLQLKHRQDDVHRLLNAHSDAISFSAAGEVAKNDFKNMLSKMDICRNQLTEILSEIEDHSRRSTEISHHLYHEVLANRMRPFEDGARAFPRMVRDVARELGKKVEFEIIGEDTLVDRDILDKIESPLNHLIRNAIDHGLETPQERLAAGKPERASIRLEARHSAGMLNIVVSDDGKGIDIEKLRDAVIAKKMIGEEPARQLRKSELLEFLFLPNFSTRDKVSTVSGRGVGLDVVHSAVQEVRGIIRTTTELGVGTSFEMQLPLTLSVMRSLLVEISGEVYAFPLAAIDHVLRLEEEVREVEGRQYLTFGNERIGLVSASQVIEKEDKKNSDEQDELLVLVISDHYNRYGLIVDDFLEIRDLVVQPLDPRLKKVQDISSVAILEDGTPVLIVDVDDMVRSIDALISGNRLRRIGGEDFMAERTVKRILVVDDSITVREVERKMLSVKGYDVMTAVDGLDGWNTLRSEEFDLVVSDVDMPRMNGIEFVSHIRQDSRYASLPVIIVSYKDREEDRNRGLEAGADYYLTKGSFQDEALVRAVEELIGPPKKD